MGPFLFCQSCNRILLAQHKSTHMHMSVQGISCSTRAYPRATCHIGGLCRTEHTLGLCSCPVHCCLTRVCHQPISSGVASMLLRTCPVLGTTDGLQDGPQDACPMHDSHRRETGRYKVPPPSSAFPSSASFPFSLNIPVWLLPSQKSELIISNQLSPSPSGRAALGHGSWGSRDCGVTAVCARVYEHGVCIYVCVCVCLSTDPALGGAQ